MKKVFALCLFIAVIAAACHKKAVPATSTTAPAAAPVVAAADAATLEAGKTILTTKCAKCHPAKNPGDYTVERWTGILTSMVPKAKLDVTETAQVTAYVNANAKK
ncbi:MAG: hypothetical protein ABUT20_38325 [Bacteroidota bacterium]